jgi:HSP20 family protein
MLPDKADILRRKGLVSTGFDDIFESFRREIEDAFLFPTRGFKNRGNEIAYDFETRLPLCDMQDLGNKYEVTLETPGIPKEKLIVRAGPDYIDISGELEEKKEEKRKNYLYNERSFSSLKRRIPTPEEIVPSKIDAQMKNGVLRIEVPKKTPTKTEETKVEVK